MPIQVSYPSADWTVLAADKTSSSGLFLIRGPVDPLNLEVAGRPEFGLARAMARRGAVFLAILRD
jgi:hypothetical protein